MDNMKRRHSAGIDVLRRLRRQQWFMNRKRYDRRSGAINRAPTFVLLVVILVIGCSAKYSVRTIKPERALQWPYAPAAAKVTYLHAIYGFQDNGSKSVLRTVVGTKKDQRGAFVTPVAITTSADGRIAVADTGCSCIHLFFPQKNRYVRLTAAGKQKIISPVNVTFDETNRLFVSDSTGSVFIFDNEGKFASSITEAGSDKLQRPTGSAYDAKTKRLFVADTLANKIYIFGAHGRLISSFGRRGEGEGQFNFPTHLFWSESGRLYVTDALNFRVQMFDESGKFLASFGHHGDGSGDIAMPKGLAVDRDGVVYLVDSLFDAVQLFNQQGNFLLTVGKRGLQFGEFWLPSGIFLDDNRELFVCDTYNRRIQVFQITENYRQ